MPLTPELRRAIDRIRDYLFAGGYPDPARRASSWTPCCTGPRPSLDVSPADEAAAATVAWHRGLVERGVPRRAHINAPASTSLSDLRDALARAGVALPAVPRSDFVARLGAALDRTPGPGASAALLGLARALDPSARDAFRPLDLFQATGFTLGADATAAALGRPPISPCSPDRLDRLVRAALESP